MGAVFPPLETFTQNVANQLQQFICCFSPLAPSFPIAWNKLGSIFRIQTVPGEAREALRGPQHPGHGPVLEWARAAGGEEWDSKQSFICIYSHIPSYNSGVTVSHHPQMGPSNCPKTSSGLPLMLHYGELYNYVFIYHNVIII